jgi:hypothetical protein
MFTAAIVSGIAYVALSISRLVGVEVVELALSALRQRPAVSVVRIEAVIDVAIEAAMSVEPGAGSDKHSANKPVGPVVPVGGALVWGIIEVSVGAYGRWSNIHADGNLGLHRGRQAQDCDCYN